MKIRIFNVILLFVQHYTQRPDGYGDLHQSVSYPQRYITFYVKTRGGVKA
ncbi:hypothetical protein GGR32_002418 [Mesonia hippocampi]|uniref:Uncharacterized protein n=1 Tax=Mesonia hippocampi TaxID=1628250 RepID=A0A840ESV5_9FLAO|nr:hypothetical protein [Mesonia hippocampi]